MRHMREKKIKIFGYYIKPTWKRPTKGVVYDPRGIAPCLTDFSGGGNLVPTVVELWQVRVTSNP